MVTAGVLQPVPAALHVAYAMCPKAMLLGGWLRSRLGHDVDVEHEPADVLVSVHVDGVAIDAPPGEAPASSDLLSDELDRFTRNRVYEDAVRAAAR